MEYLSKINKGRPSPFKGKNRWSEEQKIEIGNSQKESQNQKNLN